MKRSFRVVLALGSLLAACDPGGDRPDAGSCTLEVTLGTREGGTFTPVLEGESAELILGFQGFRMLRFAVEVSGANATEAELSAFVSIAASGVELTQRTRETLLTPTATGFVVGEWLVFFHDEPPSRIVGREAELELIVRAGGCVGGARARVIVRDDDACIDTSIVLDASVPDGAGIDADAGVCGGGS